MRGRAPSASGSASARGASSLGAAAAAAAPSAASPPAEGRRTAALRRRDSLLLLALAFLGFVSLGLPDGILGVAWPSIRGSFGLPLDAIGALLVTATGGYVVSSFASGRLLARSDLGTLLALSCLATAASLLGYASAPSWPWMVVLGTLAGLGAGAIDVGLNTFVATHHSPRTLSLLHACYGVGTAAGPLLMTAIFMAGRPWQRGYALIGAAQLALAAAFAATRRLWPGPGASRASAGADAAPAARHTLGLPSVRLAAAAFFLYVGLEASAGAWTYTLLREGRGFAMESAGAAVSVFWLGLMAGRVAFGLLPLRLSLTRLLRACIAAAVMAAAAIAADPGPLATVATVALLGAAAGPIFPALIAATPRRLGSGHAANAIGFQIASAALGQALLPACLGIAAGAAGVEVLPWLVLATGILLGGVHEGLAALAPVPARTPASAVPCADRAASNAPLPGAAGDLPG